MGILKNIDTISKRFLGFHLNYLGYILQDDAVSKSVLKQELAVLTSPRSVLAANFSQISRAVLDLK